MNFFSIFEERTNSRKFGVNIIYDIPKTALYRFIIRMGNKYSKTAVSYDGSATERLSGIEKYEDQVYGALRDAGYWVQKSDSLYSSPYLYRSIEDVGKCNLPFKVYLNPNEYSGIATETDINCILSILQNCDALSNVRLEFKKEVYDITKEEYRKVLEDAKNAVLLWIKEYLSNGLSISNIGVDFQKCFGIPIIPFEYSSDDYIAKEFVENLAFEYLENRGFPKSILRKAVFGFICKECGNIVTKSRSCAFVTNYKQQKCPKCSGEFERVF